MADARQVFDQEMSLSQHDRDRQHGARHADHAPARTQGGDGRRAEGTQVIARERDGLVGRQGGDLGGAAKAVVEVSGWNVE